MDDDTKQSENDISKSRLTGLFEDIADDYDAGENLAEEVRSQYAPPDSAARHETNLDDDDAKVPDSFPDSFSQPTILHGTALATEPDANATSSQVAATLDSLTCPFCNAAHNPEDKFCKNCGKPLLITEIGLCRRCKTPLVPNAKFCFQCGLSVAPIITLTLRQVEGDMVFNLHGDRAVYLVGRTVPEQHNYVDIDLGPLGRRKISRQHARLLYRDNVWYVEDLNSKGGTQIFNDRLQPQNPVKLKDGMVLYFADVKFKVEMSG